MCEALSIAWDFGIGCMSPVFRGNLTSFSHGCGKSSLCMVVFGTCTGAGLGVCNLPQTPISGRQNVKAIGNVTQRCVAPFAKADGTFSPFGNASYGKTTN